MIDSFNLKKYVVGKTIAGTTDSPTELSYNPAPKEAEIQFILSEIKHYLSADVDGESLNIMTPHEAYTTRDLKNSVLMT